MSETKHIDISQFRFSSDAVTNPTQADLDLWNSLTDEEKKAVILAEMDKAEKEGLAPKRSMAEIIAEARAADPEHDL